MKKVKESMKKSQNEGYVDFLENMVILLAGAYQETHDMLLRKMKEGNRAYMDMPTVQGTTMVFAVDKISRLIPNGEVNSVEVDEYVGYLEEKYKKNETSDKHESKSPNNAENMLLYMINTYIDYRYGNIDPEFRGEDIRPEVMKDIITATGMTEEFFQALNVDFFSGYQSNGCKEGE